MLNKYQFNNFTGFIYIEDYEDHEEPNRCKIYDENMCYIDYISVDEFDGVWDYESEQDYNNFGGYINYLLNLPDELSFFEQFCDSFDYGKTLERTMDNYIDSWVYEDDEVIIEIGVDLETLNDKEFCEKYDINKIGQYYFKGNW